MNFLYIAPRFHTNQIPIMKGLKENGFSVSFFSHYAGNIEDYSYVQPEIIGYSPFFLCMNYIYTRVFRRNDPMAMDKKLLLGFPPFFKLAKRLKRVNPDIVIIREKSVYSMVCYFLCRLYGFRTILYNQSPVYGKVKRDFMHWLVNSATPKVRMTPVMGKETITDQKEEGTFFVPFVMEPEVAPEEKYFMRDGVIHILTVGKYEKRKNLIEMVKVFQSLEKEKPMVLTIVGECSTGFHKAYYQALEQYIIEHNLSNKVRLMKNLSREDMKREYQQADIFVLPSTREPASISQLEAMAFSVPVICSDTNGSECYVQQGHNGFLFRDNDMEDLKQKLMLFLQNDTLIVQMGTNSYYDVKNKYQFKNYYEGIMACIQYLEKLEKKDSL